jgi:phosphatidylserine/phosphatidylglycerophosphate/cardiolipin synthase-like enzyme
MDWAEGSSHKDFLGFAIKRTPGFWNPDTKKRSSSDWLPNRIGFKGPPAKGKPDFDSNKAPVQKFMWWDARIDEDDRGASFKYEIWPVLGDEASQSLVEDSKTTLEITLPQHEENGIGTYFNRAVVSSQAFSRMLEAMGIDSKSKLSAADEKKLRTWLANDLETVVPNFLKSSQEAIGAIYHLTDKMWIIPALKDFSRQKPASMVYDAKVTLKDGKKIPSPNQDVVDKLGDKVDFFPRDKTNIMHNKFMVDGENLMNKKKAKPSRLVCGSANYNTEGISSQANLMHTFDSPALAASYRERFQIMKDNPTLVKTSSQDAGWSNTVTVGDAGIRVYFSPELKNQKDSIETIVQAIHGARSSVCFCLFTPTDQDLRDACFATGDNGKMMYGLVNHIAEKVEDDENTEDMRADKLAALELYHRNKDKKDVIGAEYFNPKTTPLGFDPELLLFPGQKYPGYSPVIIHHKFIIIDAETNNPDIYSGSANMSGNSVNKNDENLLEIRGSKRLAGIYLAEFLRLYEHYRARASYIDFVKSGGQGKSYKLADDFSWCSEHYKSGTLEYKARIAMAKV